MSGVCAVTDYSYLAPYHEVRTRYSQLGLPAVLAGLFGFLLFWLFDRRAVLQTPEDTKTKALLCELCRQFYTLGWVTGTGGSISIKTKEYVLRLSFLSHPDPHHPSFL